MPSSLIQNPLCNPMLIIRVANIHHSASILCRSDEGPIFIFQIPFVCFELSPLRTPNRDFAEVTIKKPNVAWIKRMNSEHHARARIIVNLERISIAGELLRSCLPIVKSVLMQRQGDSILLQ